MKQFYFRRGVASLMALLALSLLSLRALADEGTVPPAQPAASGSSSSDPAPAPAPVPGVLISRSDMADLPAGSEADVTVYFRNLGDVTLKGPVAAFSPVDGVSIAGGASSFLLDDIPAGGTGSVTLKLRAADTAAGAQSLPVELRFTYDEDAPASGTASDRLTIPVKAKPAAAQPLVLISRSDISSPISPGEVFDLVLTFKNTGDVTVKNAAATVAPSEGLSLLNAASTFPVSDIAPGKTASITVKLQGASQISSSAQSLSVDLRYTYGSAATAASASDRLNIPAKAASSASSVEKPVPNIVVQKFDYGGKPVAAGGRFPLSFTFENTGTTKVENIVVTVDGGEGFESPAKVQYLGNVAAGTSGSIGFALTPEAAGKLDLAIKMTYEDADLQTQTKEFPLSLTVEEGAPEPDFALDDADLAPARPAWLPVIPATAALAAAAGTVLFLVKRLRRKAAGEDPVADAWSWAEAPGEDEPEQPKEE